MHSISIYGVKSELIGDYDLDYYLDNGNVEEIYYLQNDSVYIILRLFDVWCSDLDIDGSKMLKTHDFYKAKLSFLNNNNIIKESVKAEEDIIYRIEQIQDFFDYVEKYINENQINQLYISTDYFK